jgi:mannose-1-phosphate guanylyltransferase
MAVLPADHVIPDEKKFQQVLADAFDVASRGQAIITIGIQPTEPATGYGYIHVGETLPPPQGVKPYKTLFHRAEKFVEKPYFEKALEYVNSGQYRWNAGMFIWSFVTITEAGSRWRGIRPSSPRCWPKSTPRSRRSPLTTP